MPKRKTVCACKKEFFSPIVNRYVIWVTRPVQLENGKIIQDRINLVFADKELTTFNDAEKYAIEHVVPNLKLNEGYELEKQELLLKNKCPSCIRASNMFKRNRKIAEKKRKKLGLDMSIEEALAQSVGDIAKKVEEKRVEPQTTEEKP